MTNLLRFLAPAALLGGLLLLGERPSNPPDDIPAAELSASIDDQSSRPAPCPGLAGGVAEAPAPAFRLPPSAAARLTPSAPAPETRALSPPRAA